MNNPTQRYKIRSNEEIFNAFGEPKVIGSQNIMVARSRTKVSHDRKRSHQLETARKEAIKRPKQR